MNSATIAYKQIPGPGFFSFIKNVRANPVLYCYELMKKYGDVVRCRSLQDIYLISHPVLAKEIFLNSQKFFDKNNFINNRLREVMGDGLVVSNGAKWKRQRKTGQVFFKKEELQKLAPEILRHVDDMIVDWMTKADSKQSLNIHRHFRDLAMRIMAGCLFPLENKEVLKRLKKDFFVGNEFVSNPIPFDLPGWVPMSGKARLNKAMSDIDNIILGMMTERLTTNKYEGRLLAYIMDQQYEDGNRLSQEDILAEIKNIFGASLFATSDILSWMVYSLAQYPEWADKIFTGCKAFEDSYNPDSLETAFQMQLFIHEVLRCYPPDWASSHHTLQPFELGNYVIPKHTTVLVSIYNLHHHPGFWEEPEKFNPHRFDPSNELPEKGMFVPFGLGPRKCLGMGLAKIVINIVCAKVVTHFHLRVNERVVPAIQSRVSLGAKNDLEIFLEPR